VLTIPLTNRLHTLTHTALLSPHNLFYFWLRMKVAVFLISLCLILLGGADRVFAGSHSKGCCYARTWHHEMMPDSKRNQADPASVKHSAVSPEDNLFTVDGLDEDDVEDTFARKFRLGGKGYEFLSYHDILSQLNDLFKTPPSLFHQESAKYISQRVFRV
jgi:hypothetical protein